MSSPIWYTEYRNFLKSQGICVQCGKNEAMTDRVVCGYCNEYLNEKNIGFYNRNKAAGMCVRHKNVKAAPGRTSCTECLLRDRIRGHERNRKRDKQSGEGVVE